MPQDVRHADSAPGIAKAMGLKGFGTMEDDLIEAGVIRLYVQGRRDNQPWAMDFPETPTRAQSDLYKDLATTRTSDQITIWSGNAPKGWGLEKAWERGFLFELSVGQDLPDIKAEYQETLAYTMLDYLTEPEGRPITAFRNEFRQAVDQAFNASFYGGWGDSATGAEVPEDARAWVEGKIEAEIDYADSLWQDLKDMRKEMPPDEAADWIWTRAENYTYTLDGIYDEGKIWGALEKPLTFGGDDGDETCDTCQYLKGQTYPARWWVEHDLIPGQAGNENFQCLGYHCQHVLLDRDGEVYSAESALLIARELWRLSLLEGGSGSGNFGHSGVPGQQGGSLGGGVPRQNLDRVRTQSVKDKIGRVSEKLNSLPPEHLANVPEVKWSQTERKYGLAGGQAGKVGQKNTGPITMEVQHPNSNSTLSEREMEGVLIHEVGHRVYDHNLTDADRKNWDNAATQLKMGISQDNFFKTYAPYVASQAGRDFEAFKGELFAELYMIHATNPGLLEANLPYRAKFFQDLWSRSAQEGEEQEDTLEDWISFFKAAQDDLSFLGIYLTDETLPSEEG
jgi:hypothetical protein